MASATVRITESTREALRELAAQAGVPMQTILDRAVEQYRRCVLLEKANEAFGALRHDPQLWHEEQQEREAWDTTLADGVDDGETAAAGAWRGLVGGPQPHTGS